MSSLACGGEGGDQSSSTWVWLLPDNVPPPIVSEDNPMSQAKVDLGRMLFYDPALSGNGTQSCASCHEQAKAFAQDIPVPQGSTGIFHTRNSQGLSNVSYASALTWANPILTSLELQIRIPMFGEDPIELGIVGNEDVVLGRFANDPEYMQAFAEAFPESVELFTFDSIVHALAAFIRTLISFESPYDRFTAGDTSAMSESAQRGLELFFSERLECFHCHGGFLFSGASVHEGQVLSDRPFFNTGLYNLGGNGDYPSPNTGLFEITNQAEDMGRFRPPSLRNVSVTAPYMHDGSVATLEEVIRIYERGGRLRPEGDGALNPFKSGFINGFTLTDEERSDILAFLESLTDQAFLDNPAHADPGVRADL